MPHPTRLKKTIETSSAWYSPIGTIDEAGRIISTCFLGYEIWTVWPQMFRYQFWDIQRSNLVLAATHSWRTQPSGRKHTVKSGKAEGALRPLIEAWIVYNSQICPYLQWATLAKREMKGRHPGPRSLPCPSFPVHTTSYSRATLSKYENKKQSHNPSRNRVWQRTHPFGELWTFRQMFFFFLLEDTQSNET